MPKSTFKSITTSTIKPIKTQATRTSVTTDTRLDLLTQWLQAQSYQDFILKPASQDASFRRYFRMTRAGQKSLIIMDAPPEKESLSPFIEIARDWGLGAIAVPKVYEYSREHGFLILQDFGSETVLGVLNPDNLMRVYQAAIDELLRIQVYSTQYSLPVYSEALLLSEMQLFIDWFLLEHCDYALTAAEEKNLHALFKLLKNSALQQQQVSVHRDYHSRNLMHRPDQPPGVIDFQDAVQGPVTYDLVSLLKDCYIKLEHAQRRHLFNYYVDTAQAQGVLTASNMDRLQQDFDRMGMQRHLKAIGIFARLYHRDGKADYLNDIPRTASYISDLAGTYPELNSLGEILATVMPRLESTVMDK